MGATVAHWADAKLGRFAIPLGEVENPKITEVGVIVPVPEPTVNEFDKDAE